MTLAEMLRGAGYQTAFIGKWHLGIPTDLSTWAYNRGFDYAVQEQWGPKPEGGAFDERVHWVNNRDDSVLYDYTKYSCLDEFRTDLALKFLDEQRDSTKPLFLFMCYRTPHAHEYHLRETDLYSNRGWPENERLHAARITMLDEQIQRLLDKLDETGELDHTLILFASDNGPTKEGVDPAFFNASGEFRGYKRDVYEGGIRIPFIAVWNGKIPAGRTSDYPGIFYDIMPTLAELAGIPAPDQTDGISILPELLGKEQPEHPPLYWEIQLVSGKANDFRQAARLGPWKVVRYGSDGAPQLYDLDRDSRETKNLAAGYPEILQKMSAVLKTNSQKSPNYPYAGRDF
jgi:arylsulfatase A-like enzyme